MTVSIDTILRGNFENDPEPQNSDSAWTMVEKLNDNFSNIKTDLDAITGGGNYLLADGTVPLTTNWDVGGWSITHVGVLEALQIKSPSSSLMLVDSSLSSMLQLNSGGGTTFSVDLPDSGSFTYSQPASQWQLSGALSVTGLATVSDPTGGPGHGLLLSKMGLFPFGDAGGSYPTRAGDPTFQNQYAADANTVLRVMPKGTGNSQFEFFNNDYYAVGDAWENFKIISNPAYFHLTTASGSLGTNQPLYIGAATSTTQLRLLTDGTITTGSDLTVGGNVSATNLSGTNTGDQSSIVGITGTKAEFDTAVTDGDIQYVGDAPTSHTIASHSDTTATGTELNSLTNNSIVDAKHRHSELVSSDGSVDPALSVDASGSVGIGTTSPDAILHVATNSGDVARLYKAIDSSGGANFRLLKSRGTISAPTAILSGDTIGKMGIYGYNGTAFTAARGFVIFSASENWTGSANGTKATFGVTPNGSTTISTVLTLENDGNVGIGASPNAKLTVEGTATLKEQASAATSTSGYGQIWVKSGTSNTLTFTDAAGTESQLQQVFGGMHLTLTTAQNHGGAVGTVVYVDWDGTELLKDTGFTHSTSTNPSRVQVDATGRYSLTWTMSAIQGGSARTTLMTQYRVNGTTVVTRGRQRNYSRGSAYGDISVGMVTELDLTSGDYIEAGTTVDATNGVYTINSVPAECELIIRRIS